MSPHHFIVAVATHGSWHVNSSRSWQYEPASCLEMCIPRFAIPAVAIIIVGIVDVVAAPSIFHGVLNNIDEQTHCGTYFHLFWLVNISTDAVHKRTACNDTRSSTHNTIQHITHQSRPYTYTHRHTHTHRYTHRNNNHPTHQAFTQEPAHPINIPQPIPSSSRSSP